MKQTKRHIAVFVTAPDGIVARQLARAAVEARCCACAQVLPEIESHYWWEGKIESGREVLIIFKTTKIRLPALEALIRREHPYKVPQIVALPISSGSSSYLAWLDEETRQRKPASASTR